MLEYFKPTAILLSADPATTSTSSCGATKEEGDILDEMLGGGGGSEVCKFAAGSVTPDTPGSNVDGASGGAWFS